MKPKRKNIKMLKTLSVTGTNTPAKVPSFAVPPTGLGKAPGLGLRGSLDDLDCEVWNVRASHVLVVSMPWSLSSASPSTRPSCSAWWLLPGRSGVSSVDGDEAWWNEGWFKRSASSLAVRAAKLERALGGICTVACRPSLASVMVWAFESTSLCHKLSPGSPWVRSSASERGTEREHCVGTGYSLRQDRAAMTLATHHQVALCPQGEVLRLVAS